MPTRATSLRMPEGMADELSAVARAAGESIAEVVRLAIEKEIAARVAEPSFQERRKKILEKDVNALRRLAPPEDRER
jgi:hypothetical protein